MSTPDRPATDADRLEDLRLTLDVISAALDVARKHLADELADERTAKASRSRTARSSGVRRDRHGLHVV